MTESLFCTYMTAQMDAFSSAKQQLFRNISIFILLNVNITCTLRTSTALVKLYIIPRVTPEAKV